MFAVLSSPEELAMLVCWLMGYHSQEEWTFAYKHKRGHDYLEP